MVRVVAIALAALLAAPGFGLAQAAGPWNNVRGLPAGSRLKLVLTNGSELTGTVVSTTDDRVIMRNIRAGAAGWKREARDAGSPPDQVPFARADVAMASVASVATRLHSDGPDSEGARWVVRALGVGKKIQVTTATGAVKGKIAAVGDGAFEVSAKPSPVRIAYGDVRDITPTRMRVATKAAIISGAAIGGLVLAMGLCYASGSCVS